MTTEINALPKSSTLRLSSPYRAIGRLTNLTVYGDAPEGPAEADLLGDVFFNSLLDEPKPLDEVPAERQLNRQLLDWMQDSHGWRQSKESTSGNIAASAAAAPFMWAHLMNDETIKEALKKQEEAEQQAQEARSLNNQADVMQMAADGAAADGDGQSASQFQSQADTLRQQAAQAQANAQALAQAATDQLQAERSKPLKDAAMATAARDAAAKAKEVAESMAGWGMGPGSSVKNDPAAALEFLKANRGKLAKIAKMAGRMRGFSMTGKREKVPVGVVPSKVGFTRDFTKIFATDLAYLNPNAPAVLRAPRVDSFVNQGLMGYIPSGEKEKRGPFVAGVDVSPSMRVRGREIVAKGVALGIAQTAQADGRDYILFCFASDEKEIRVVTNRDDWRQHLEWAGTSTNGGTDFDMAIAKGMELLGNIQNADFLFISDGEAKIKPATATAWSKFKEETGARMFYVPVAAGYPDIEVLSDRVYHITDLEEETGQELARELGRWI